MVLLSATFDPHGPRGRATVWAPSVVAASVAITLVCLGLAMAMLDGRLRGFGRAMATAAVHGGLLAIGWILATGERPLSLGPALRLAAVVLVAASASRVTAWGALFYLLPPGLLLREARRHPILRRAGLGVSASGKSTVLGLAAGAFLGVHLLIAASLTLGYNVRVEHLEHYLAAVAYDIGANALTAEWLFRGALFSRCWQRREFWPAAGLSTAFAVGRYLVDPALPGTLEVRAGAVFYMSLLGLSACALRAASGSLVPGYLASVVFFAAYRLLMP
jgi:hypothetical protein